MKNCLVLLPILFKVIEFGGIDCSAFGGTAMANKSLGHYLISIYIAIIFCTDYFNF
jgi:hypothetical protein